MVFSESTGTVFLLCFVLESSQRQLQQHTPGAIMSFDNREDFEKNLNGSLTVDSWKRWRMMEDDM